MVTETINVLKSHRSIRNFTDEKIPMETLKELIQAGQSAATSHFVQAYSVILVEDTEKRKKIAEVAKQNQVTDSPVFLVFCADLKRLEHASNKHALPFKYDTVENFLVGAVDTALVAQNVLVAAESLGYGGCYVGGIRNNLNIVSEVLGLPDKVYPVFGMTLGRPAKDQDLKPRLPVEAILHVDQYEETKYESLLNEFDQVIQEYYASRSNNNKEINWTGLMADFYSSEKRAYLKGFLEEKGFHLN